MAVPTQQHDWGAFIETVGEGHGESGAAGAVHEGSGGSVTGTTNAPNYCDWAVLIETVDSG